MNTAKNENVKLGNSKEIELLKIRLGAEFMDLQELYSVLKRHRSLLLALRLNHSHIEEELYEVHKMLEDCRNKFNKLNGK